MPSAVSYAIARARKHRHAYSLPMVASQPRIGPVAAASGQARRLAAARY